MKKIIGMILALAVGVSLFACGGGSKSATEIAKIGEVNLEKEIANNRFAVVYFSVDDQVKIVAEEFATELNADLHEIVPKVPYKDTDLDFDDPTSRVSIEDKISLYQDEEEEEETYETSYGAIVPTTVKAEVEVKAEFPEINKINVGNSQIIVVGFPVWNENAPKPVYSFLKDLKNKIIIPFCTDGEFGKIDEYINNFVDKSCKVMTGKSFSEESTIEELRNWVAMLSTDF